MEKEEIVIWEGSSSQVLNFKYYVLSVLMVFGVVFLFILLDKNPMAFIGLLLPAFYSLAKWLEIKSVRYKITTERLIIRRGFLSITTNEIELYRIKDYTLQEPFFFRLFKLANIEFQTSDVSSPKIVLSAIPEGERIRNEVRKTVERLRENKVRNIDQA